MTQGQAKAAPSSSAPGITLAWVGPVILLAWVLGTVALVEQPALQTPFFYTCISALALAVIALAALVFRVHDRQPNRASGWVVWALAALASALLAHGSTGWRAVDRQSQWLPPAWEGRSVGVQVQVDALPVATDWGWRVNATVKRVLTHEAPVPPRIQLNWPLREGMQAPRAGEVWQLTVRLKRPHGLANPHGFDAELWWWEQGIGATGSVRWVRRGASSDRPAESAEPWPERLAHAPMGLLPWRELARERLQRHLAGSGAAPPPTQPGTEVSDPAGDAAPSGSDRSRSVGVLTALVVGDQSAIAQGDWAVFRATGVGHLISVSGVHITLWAWLTAGVVGWLWRLAPRLSPDWGVRLLLACPAPLAARWGGLALAAAYAAFSGWGVPAQRTVLMLATWVVLRHHGRQWPAAWVWLAALGVVLVWDPWAWHQPGFWLSFVAVGVLMGMSPELGRDSGHRAPVWEMPGSSALRFGLGVWRRGVAGLASLWATQWRISLVLAPLTLGLFGQVSVVGLFANLVAIPVVTFLLTPLALAGLVWPPLWTLASGIITLGLSGLEVAASWPLASLTLPKAPWGWSLFGLLGAWVAVMRWPPGLRLLGILAMVPALTWQPARPDVGQFELLAVDVGQGSAVRVQTARHSLLVDAGPRWGPESDAGQRVLVPLLHALGDELDGLVLTHADTDHVGGADSVRQAWPQAQVWASFPPRDPSAARWSACQAGLRWVWDGVMFEFLHPLPGAVFKSTDTNNRSCVLRVTGGAATALLMGDLDARHESDLVQRVPDLRAQWLLAPHHGSRHSSSDALLQSVKPDWVFIQAGYRNRYGHPAPEVLERLQVHGLRWRASPDCGAATWRSREPDRLVCWRDEQPRHWRPPVPRSDQARAVN